MNIIFEQTSLAMQLRMKSKLRFWEADAITASKKPNSYLITFGWVDCGIFRIDGLI